MKPNGKSGVRQESRDTVVPNRLLVPVHNDKQNLFIFGTERNNWGVDSDLIRSTIVAEELKENIKKAGLQIGFWRHDLRNTEKKNGILHSTATSDDDDDKYRAFVKWLAQNTEFSAPVPLWLFHQNIFWRNVMYAFVAPKLRICS